MIRCIAAIDNKRGMATDEGIPWKLPTDSQFFVDQTREGLIIMGYGTYREFSKPLHGRTNYVATSREEPLKPGFEVVHNTEAFFTEHQNQRINNIGGAGFFASTLAWADELILTLIQADFHCSKFFPEYESGFQMTEQSDPITENGVTFTFTTWQRK